MAISQDTTITYSITTYGVKHVDSTTIILANNDHIVVNKRIFKNSHPLSPLPDSFINLKIALDPGHNANDSTTAILEGKFIKLKHPLSQDSIFFYEADIAYKTCLYLKDSLEKLGATVLISRSKDETAFGKTYRQWLEKDFIRSLDSIKTIDTVTYKTLAQLDTSLFLDQKIIFHQFFKYLDFQKRATRINNFAPDVSLVIHYNVDVNNKPWQTPTDKNHSMAFVPGSFLSQELLDSTDQKDFCRIHSSNSISESISLSSFILKGIESFCSISPLVNMSNISYLKKYTIPTPEPGVYCRNLAMTRKIKGRICFLEGSYQDNYDEALSLNKSYTSSEIPDRIKEIGNGIIFGIKNYIKENHN